MPIPPRWWLATRLLLTAAALAVIIAPLWLAWDHVASRRLAARIALLRSQGEPIFRADFVPPPLPDDQNAAVLLKAAGAAVPEDPACPNSSNLTFPDYPPFPPPWRSMIDAAMAANAQPLRLAREARSRNDAVWLQVPPAPIEAHLGADLTFLNSQRALANLLADAAMADHIDGNDAEAIERIRDVFHQADMLDRHNFLLINRLVSIGIDAVAQARLQVICSDNLRIGDAPVATAHGVVRPARAAVIRQLIRYLLDDRPQQVAIRNAILGERMMLLDLASDAAAHSLLLRPMLQLDEVHVLDRDELYLQAARQPAWPATGATAVAVPPDVPRVSRPVSQQNFFGRSGDRFLLTNFRVMADRQALAAILALRLYQADHGHWPRRLGELVPRYLPAVPVDRFSTGAPPLGYMVVNDPTVSKEPRPVVFFNQHATTATTAPMPPAYPCIGWQNSTASQWRDAAHWTAVPQP